MQFLKQTNTNGIGDPITPTRVGVEIKNTQNNKTVKVTPLTYHNVHQQFTRTYLFEK